MKKIQTLFFLVALSFLQFSCSSDAIDLDPQGNATTGLGLYRSCICRNIFK